MSDLLKSPKPMAQWLIEFVFLLSWPPFMMSFIYPNSRNASKCLLRSLNHKSSRSSLIYLISNDPFRFLIPRKEPLEEERLRCIKSCGIIILKKKPPGKLKTIFTRTSLNSLRLLRYLHSRLYHSYNLGMRFILGGEGCDTLGV
jgi:hypothetical protein